MVQHVFHTPMFTLVGDGTCQHAYVYRIVIVSIINPHSWNVIAHFEDCSFVRLVPTEQYWSWHVEKVPPGIKRPLEMTIEIMNFPMNRMVIFQFANCRDVIPVTWRVVRRKRMWILAGIFCRNHSAEHHHHDEPWRTGTRVFKGFSLFLEGFNGILWDLMVAEWDLMVA